MEQKTQEKTLFEQAGVPYIEKGGLLYPVMGKEEMDTEAYMGKYGRLWLKLLFQIDRHGYHMYLLEGKLVEMAIEFNARAYMILEDLTEEYLKKYPFKDKHATMEILTARLQAQVTAEEIIVNDARQTIENERSVVW